MPSTPKPLLLKVGESAADSLDVRHEQRPYFDNPWHYHPELELTLVTRSTGLRFVGDCIEPFGPGDLVLLGPNLPHYWRNDAAYFGPTPPDRAEALILRFRSDAWGRDLLHRPELRPLRELFRRAERGLHFPASVAATVEPRLRDLLRSEGVGRLVVWLNLFADLAAVPGGRMLSDKAFGGGNPAQDSARISRVLDYVQQHLTEPIRLEEVAAVANLNPAAFCRYFKQQTNQTFVELLNDLRINYACRLLIDSDRDVGQVCFESGFRNVPHFNQVFKARKGVSPSAFRRERG
jgi:AraC-like DNA-binding protein